MMDFKDLYKTIKLDGETVFYHYISQDKDKLDIYKKALSEGKITDFDQTTITRLRKLYYGLYSGLIYMYMEPTTFNNIANKVELLTHVFEDKKYNIVHGNVDSIKNIMFSMYGVEHLDFNSWVEVEEGNKTWVYDTFSMMKIEKEVYYKLENPEIKQVIPKKVIMEHPGRDRDDYTFYHDGFNYVLIGVFEQLEKNMDSHPFKHILAPELTRFKKEINFDDILLEWHKEEMEIKRSCY